MKYNYVAGASPEKYASNFRQLNTLLGGLRRDTDGAYVLKGPIRVGPEIDSPFVGGSVFIDIRSEHALTDTYVATKFETTQTVAMSASQSAQAFEANIVAEHASGTVAAIMGSIGHAVLNGAGTVTEARGGSFSSGNLSTGTLTYAKGVHIEPGFNTGGGTVTTQAGVYIAVQVGATTNYAIEAVNAFRVDYSTTGGDARFMVWDVTAGSIRRVKVDGSGTLPSGGTGQVLYL